MSTLNADECSNWECFESYCARVSLQCKQLNVPMPDSSALEKSYQNYCRLITKINLEESKSISFAQFIHHALYDGETGYYVGGHIPIGKAGDFVTAPELFSGFGESVVRCFSPKLDSVSHWVEFGAGSGVLAVQILTALRDNHTEYLSYSILEVSSTLKEKQKQLLIEANVYNEAKIRWIDCIEDAPKNANLFGNEVLDAIPAHRMIWNGSEFLELMVKIDQHYPTVEWGAIRSPELVDYLHEHQHRLTKETDYIYEVAPWRNAWVNSLCRHFEKCRTLLIDYGYGAEEFFHSQRTQGTLTCFYQHHQHNDPFVLLGLQDITSHVNFSEICYTAENNGFSLEGFCTQADWLVKNQSLQFFKSDHEPTSDSQLKQRLLQSQSLQRLLLPSEMGEIIKVIAFSKDICDNARLNISNQLESRL